MSGRAKKSSTGYTSDDYYTPTLYASAVKKVFVVINLDPASCWRANEIIEAEKYFTASDDGLKQSWAGYEKIYLNPPYSCASKWIDKLLDEYEASKKTQRAILLTNTRVTDTVAFQRLKRHQGDFLCCLVSIRIRFIHPGKITRETGMMPSLFTYLGNTETNYLEFCKFAEVFSQLGLIVK